MLYEVIDMSDKQLLLDMLFRTDAPPSQLMGDSEFNPELNIEHAFECIERARDFGLSTAIMRHSSTGLYNMNGFWVYIQNDQGVNLATVQNVDVCKAICSCLLAALSKINT